MCINVCVCVCVNVRILCVSIIMPYKEEKGKGVNNCVCMLNSLVHDVCVCVVFC